MIKEKPIKCCGQPPEIHDSDHNHYDVDEIECKTCYRTVFGIDDDSAKSWNDGENDLP